MARSMVYLRPCPTYRPGQLAPMPRIAVHLVTYNNEDTIRECLAALLAQEEPFTPYIIDNASTDRTRSTVRPGEALSMM